VDKITMMKISTSILPLLADMMLRPYIIKIDKIAKRIQLIIGTTAFALLSLFISGCYPVHLPESIRADNKSEYRTKYFSFKPPVGRWTVVLDVQRSFTDPYQGNLLTGTMSEIVKLYNVPKVWAVGLELRPTITICSYPLFQAERFNDDPALTAETVKIHFEQSRKGWWTYRQQWSGKLNKVQTKPTFKALKIGSKTFYESSEVYADSGARIKGGSLTYYYFSKKRAFVFYSEIGLYDKDSALVNVIESFEPTDYNPTKAEELLEKALYLWTLGPTIETTVARSDFIADYSFENVSQAFQIAISENPNNPITHFFYAIHFLAPKENFYLTYVAPRLNNAGNAQKVSTENMMKFDYYGFNEIWVINKREVCSYLLHGKFDDNMVMDELQKTLEIEPDLYTAQYLLSWLYLRKQEYEKAVLEFNKIIEKNPKDADSLLLLSIAYKAMGSQKEADDYYEAFRRAARTDSLSDFLDNFLGPSLSEALGRALGEAIGRGSF
jgi:tetratricopeptide (TPR) repeat protein